MCQCVTEREREHVSGEPRGSVPPSVSETHWTAGEERAWGSQHGWLLLPALPSTLHVTWSGHFPALGLSFLSVA